MVKKLKICDMGGEILRRDFVGDFAERFMEV